MLSHRCGKITSMESAIILAVPEAEPLVGALRKEGDASAAHGVPAHVTLLYPFVEDPDEGIVEELRFFFAGVDAFPLTFTGIGHWPEVVYLAVQEAPEVHGLIESLVRRWPGYPPYGGAFALEDVVPHLTVVDTPDAQLRDRAAAHIATGLPLHAAAHEASLWMHREDGWVLHATFPLAPHELG